MMNSRTENLISAWLGDTDDMNGNGQCCILMQQCLCRTQRARSATGPSPPPTTGAPWVSYWCMTSPTRSLSAACMTGESFHSVHDWWVVQQRPWLVSCSAACMTCKCVIRVQYNHDCQQSAWLVRCLLRGWLVSLPAHCMIGESVSRVHGWWVYQ